MTIKINYESLNRMLEAMDQVGSQRFTVDDYFRAHVCDTSGFDYYTCALQPLSDLLTDGANWFSGACDDFTTRWQAFQQGIATTAHQIDAADGRVDHDLSYYLPALPGVPHVRPYSADFSEVADFDIHDPADSLTAPEDGGDQLKGHDQDFMAISEGYDDIRDQINTLLDWINHLPGVDLPKLPDKSLRDYIVYPLSGNYHRIQANAAACDIFKDGMTVWGANFTRVAGKVALAIEGQTGAAVAGQLALYDLAMKGVGEVVHLANAVFKDIAIMSERIAIEVERAIILLGKKLAALLKKVLKHISSFVGWLSTIWDTISDGLDWVDEIIDDVKDVIHIIEACFDLVDKVKAWAEAQARRLHALSQIPQILGDLPSVSELGSLQAIESVDLGRIRRTLTDLTASLDYGSTAGSTQDELTTAVGELTGKATPEPHGPKILAPGPSIVDLGPDGTATTPSTDSQPMSA